MAFGIGIFISTNLYALSKYGDPVKLGIALAKLECSGLPMVSINMKPQAYLTRNNNGYQLLQSALQAQGWNLQNIEEDKLVFVRKDEEITAVGHSFRGNNILITLHLKHKALPPPETITLTAAGDILMHNTQISSGLQPDGSYSFDSFFAPVKDLLEEGDYCSTNFEAALAGEAAGYSGYPLFNSPDAIADTFKDAGFDLVVTANNHCLDRGYAGALRTIKVLREAGLDTTGTYLTPEEHNNFLVKDIRGVKVGYLAYTYGTNGIPIPEQCPHFVRLLDQRQVMQDIERLRPAVDVLILILHWGTEYSPEATEEQKRLARTFLTAGADVILGSHPHVIEPMEILKIGGKDKFVIYSMGNFIGHQRGWERNSGLILKLKFTKDFRQGETYLQEVSYVPTFSHPFIKNGRQQFRVVPVEKAIDNIEKGQEPYLTASDLPVLKKVLDHTHKQLGEPFFKTAPESNHALNSTQI